MCKNTHGPCTVAVIQLYVRFMIGILMSHLFYILVSVEKCSLLIPYAFLCYYVHLYVKHDIVMFLQPFSYHSAINLKSTCWNMKAELLSRFLEQVVYFILLHTTFPRHFYEPHFKIWDKYMIVIRRQMSKLLVLGRADRA